VDFLEKLGKILRVSRRRNIKRRNNHPPAPGGVGEIPVLPPLATAEQIAAVLQVSARTIHLWAEAGTIPTALRNGRVVRFNPPAVAAALGISPGILSKTL